MQWWLESFVVFTVLKSGIYSVQQQRLFPETTSWLLWMIHTLNIFNCNYFLSKKQTHGKHSGQENWENAQGHNVSTRHTYMTFRKKHAAVTERATAIKKQSPTWQHMAAWRNTLHICKHCKAFQGYNKNWWSPGLVSDAEKWTTYDNSFVITWFQDINR